MTDVSILPPHEYQHFPVWSARIIKKARNDAQLILARTRIKAAKYLRISRNRGREAGLKEGLELARAELQVTLNQWNQRLNECLSQLSNQVEEGALALAEQIVGKEVRERSSAYRQWLEEALTTLRREQTLTLHCSPEHYEMICELTQNCDPKITVYSDHSLSAPEIFIQSTLGTIGFGWREALECAASTREK